MPLSQYLPKNIILKVKNNFSYRRRLCFYRYLSHLPVRANRLAHCPPRSSDQPPRRKKRGNFHPPKNQSPFTSVPKNSSLPHSLIQYAPIPALSHVEASNLNSLILHSPITNYHSPIPMPNESLVIYSMNKVGRIAQGAHNKH